MVQVHPPLSQEFYKELNKIEQSRIASEILGAEGKICKNCGDLGIYHTLNMCYHFTSTNTLTSSHTINSNHMTFAAFNKNLPTNPYTNTLISTNSTPTKSTNNSPTNTTTKSWSTYFKSFF